jgi:hypothetical protein
MCQSTTTDSTSALVTFLITMNVLLYFAISLNIYFGVQNRARMTQLLERLQQFQAATTAPVGTAATADGYQPVP